MSTPLSASGLGFLRHRAGDRVKNRYEVLDHLGGGNFGSVYRVRDEAVGNVLACKELHVLNDPSTATDERESALAMFKREALNLATLRHPHIPAAYFEQEEGLWKVCPRCGLDFPDAAFCPDHGAQLLPIQSRHYLMMDFIDGPTLEELAHEYMAREGRPLPEDQCVEWIAEIGSALRALHVVGIVHRDIKPDNIKIRSGDNAAFLLDFGLTRKVEEAGFYGTARISGTGRMGTFGYAPPSPQEQQNPERRSDIHALGMTLYRLVSNRDPQDSAQLLDMSTHAPRYFNNSLSPETERIIRLATAGDVSKRYQTIDDLLADLQVVRGDSSPQSYAPPFTFSDGSRARTVRELARLVEAHPDESLPYLFNGMFAGWLRQNGFAAPAQMAESVVKQHESKPGHALEMFRRALYPLGAHGVSPRLEVEPASLSFATIDSGGMSTHVLRIRNVGPGLAWGSIQIEDAISSRNDGARGETSLPGLSFARAFEGNDVSLQIALDTGQVPNGAYSGTILIRLDDPTIAARTAQNATNANATNANATNANAANANATNATNANATKGTATGTKVIGALSSANMTSTNNGQGALQPGAAGAGVVFVDDAIRVAVDYTVRALELRAVPESLDFGQVLVGRRAVRTVRIERVSQDAQGVSSSAQGGSQSAQGVPRGTVYAGASLGGMVVRERFSGEGAIEVCVDGAMPDVVARAYEGALQFDTNGGRLRVPVRYAFSLPPWRWLALVGGAALVGGLGSAFARLLYFVVNPWYALRWLSQNGLIAPLEVANMQAPIALGALLGLGWGLWWTARLWNSNSRAPSFQALGQTLLLCVLLGAALFWPLIWALHWTVWGLGDWILRPLSAPLETVSKRIVPAMPEFAPLMWGAIGTLIGGALGIGRAFAALGKVWVRYAVYALLLLAFFAALINAMLA